MIGSWGRRPNVGNRPRFRSSRKCMRRWLGLGRHLFLPETGLLPPPSSPPSTAERPKCMWRSPQSSAPLPCSFARKALPPGGVIHAFRPGPVSSRPLYGQGLRCCWTGRFRPARHGPPAGPPGQGVETAARGWCWPRCVAGTAHSDGPRTKGDESHGAGPESDDVHISGPGAPPVADLGGYEGVRQAPLPGLPDLPGRPIRRSGGGLCPTVLRRTEADRGVSSHPAPAVRCCLHPTAGCSPSVCSSPRAPSCCLHLRSSSATTAACTTAAAWSWPQETGAARLRPCQAREAPGQAASLRRATRSLWILLFRRWWPHHSFPRRRAGWRIFCFLFVLFRHWPPGLFCSARTRARMAVYETSSPHSCPPLSSPVGSRVRSEDATPSPASPAQLWSQVSVTPHTQTPLRDALPFESGPCAPFRCPTVGTSVTPLVPLARSLGAWLELPRPSRWLLRTIRLGYAIQFARRPPKFRGIRFTSVLSKDAPVLRAEVAVLLAKDAIEPVPPAEMKSGFYSPYFIVPKKDGGLRPILDLRVLNRALHKLPFRMLTQRRIFQCVRPFDWFAAIDLKDAYFHVSILPRHRPFLRFAFEGRAYQYKALPFGLSLSPRVFTKVVEAALVPLREAGIHILNYLDDWLILAQSRALLCEHRDMVLSHLSRLGLQVNREKSKLSPTQRISFLGMELDSVKLTARLSEERAQSMLRCLESLQRKRAVPLKHFRGSWGIWHPQPLSRRSDCFIWDRFSVGFTTGSRDGHGATAHTGSHSPRPAVAPSALGRTLRFFGQECP